MVRAVMERKNRDFFYQVTLVVGIQVTSKTEANLRFHQGLSAGAGPPPANIPYFFLLRLTNGAIRAGVKHIANFAVPA